MLPALSVIMPARSGFQITQNCLASLFMRFSGGKRRQFILIDDDSEPKHRIQDMFTGFASKMQGHDVEIVRTGRWEHYTGVLRIGLERATRDYILFISNDMVLTQPFLDGVWEAMRDNPDAGIVRGTSRYTDSHPEYRIVPPLPHKSMADVVAFAEYVKVANAGEVVEDELLSGDCVLIRREMVQDIGLPDTQFFGYFGDPDYGLRAQIAGWKLLCAKSAWLHHEGGGHIIEECRGGVDPENHAHVRRMALVHAAYEKFKAKWGHLAQLPDVFENVQQIPWRQLRDAAQRKEAV